MFNILEKSILFILNHFIIEEFSNSVISNIKFSNN